MKQTNYIFAFLFCFFFLSCEKEEFSVNNSNGENNDEYYINPEDTAGIIVPEGYSLVYFAGNRAMTRAETETRIQHLRYIIYQSESEMGEYTQAYNVVVPASQLSSWPVKGIIYFVPKDKYYKVVFLGNVDKSVFTNQETDVLANVGKGSKFEDARIILPRVEFSDNNMYYLASTGFNSLNAEGKEIVYAPVTLQRIVSRNDITKEGLSADYIGEAQSNATYLTAYWRQLIKTKLKESIFTGENSVLRYQVGEALKNNLIYPLIYTGLANADDASGLVSSYPVISHYLDEWKSSEQTAAFQSTVQYLRNIYSEFVASGNNYSNNLCLHYAQYLYDTFVQDISADPLTLTTGLSSIFNKDIYYRDPQVINSDGSVTRAVNKLIDLFKTNYTSGELYPWRNMGYSRAVVEISAANPLPGAIGFDKQRDAAYDASGELYYQLRDNGYSTDQYISIVTLGGESTSTDKLHVSKIYVAATGGFTIDYAPTRKTEIVSNEFEAGGFRRNIRSVTTQQLKSISLGDTKLLMEGAAYQQKIEVNFYDVFQAMNPQSDDTNQRFTLGNAESAKFTITGVPDYAAIKVAHMQSYILNVLNYKYNLENTDDSELSFPFVTFTCPVVSPANLHVTTEWTVTTAE